MARYQVPLIVSLIALIVAGVVWIESRFASVHDDIAALKQDMTAEIATSADDINFRIGYHTGLHASD